MTVRIVTDSLSDLTTELTGKLDITLVPLTVLFGHETFLDRVTISTDEFYHRLIHGDIWPASTQPSPQDFANTYDKLCETTNEILVLILSSRLSGTYQSAMAGKIVHSEDSCQQQQQAEDLSILETGFVGGDIGTKQFQPLDAS